MSRSRFLVRITVELPDDLPGDERERLLSAESVRGRELLAEGTLEHIWRVAGARENISIYHVASTAELHDCLQSLPLFPYLRTRVTPLCDHPLTAPES